MVKPLKKIASVFLIIALMLPLISSTVFAGNSIEDDSIKTIKTLLNAVSEHDWNLYADQLDSKNRKDFHEFVETQTRKNKPRGILLVNSAELKEIRKIENISIPTLLLYCDIDTTINPTDIRAYIVGVDYNVSDETKYYVNGLCYELYVLVKENSTWKVNSTVDAPIDMLTDCSLSKTDVEKEINRYKEREQGNIINHYGELIERNDSISLAATESYVCPEDIDIYRKEEDYGGESWSFKSYLECVLTKEAYSTWPKESLRAIAMAIQNYAWYSTLHPRHKAEGCAVCDAGAHCQVFRDVARPQSVKDACTYVLGKYMTTSSGKLFLGQHVAGKYSTEFKSTGKLRQKGCQYWGDKGKTWTYMVHYYYDGFYNRSTHYKGYYHPLIW